MKASELRIGNIVQDEHGILMYVYRIWQHGAELVEYEDGDNDLDYSEDQIFGVPLTEEWLEKFWFKYIDILVGFNQYRKNLLELSITPNGFEIFFTFKWIKIKYVHQLQNLYFALTGEELTLEK